MEPILITCPRPRSTIPGTTMRVIASNPLIFVSIMMSHSSKLPSNSLSTPITSPALLTSTSIAFHSSGKDSKAAAACFRSRTSKGSIYTRTPYIFSNSAFSSSNFDTVRAFKIKFHPSFANLRAQPSPIPLLAPVIKTILASIMFRFTILVSKSTP